MEQYKCRHFAIHELVPPHIYKKWGEKAWMFLQADALKQLDSLRDRFGSMTVNNYEFGGNRSASGLRTSGSDYYSETSQHSFGGAFDCLFKDYTAEQVRQEILANQDDVDFMFIGSLELGTSWLHFDVRNCDSIMTYTP